MMAEDLFFAAKIFYEAIDKDKNYTINKLNEIFPGSGKKLFYLMPIAFGWVVLSRLGADKFPEKIEFNDVSVNAREDELFVSCLRMADKEIKNNYSMMSLDVFERILNFSAEGKIASALFKDGGNARGACISAPIIDDDLLE
ncbi:hypothetical protein [Bacterioplanoides sp. SCSIO 12839]|uniref:hypothetical protein n=1 Tax=Bacterioplanoides sp. SCSIO 12839 TaxID=2829569 RepID=UPI0021077B82|nr:hypothetical protein [Bacterioplanoides sp. SCSIO 12839]UTW46938.1 hypothetical protein KFF03_10035 [Bacterioplanoides sp. SCSIO 12839]